MTFDLPLAVDRSGGVPLNEQLAGQLRAAMREGRLVAGERLPSSRALAGLLGVSRTVVTESYGQLYAEGWLEGRHGSGTYVTDIAVEDGGAGEVAAITGGGAVPPDEVRPGMIDLRPGVAWSGGLDTPAWRRAWRLAAAVPPAVRPDPHGLPGLRVALADHVRRSRGVACPVERLLITRGATNGLDLLAATVLRPGDRVGVEEPGYGKARSVLRARGMEMVPCPVDEHGLIVDGLPGDLRLVYTTPSHQFPLGGVLPVPRRQALLAWARRTGALIAEDDYDGEFRYDVAPLPALYGMDPEVVVYLGTTSKILTADMGVGWLVARPDLMEAVARRREELSDRTAVVPQEALRVLLERGDLDRYVRRMRAEYARRRAVVTGALAGLPLRGDTAGLHLVAGMPEAVARYAVQEAARRGVLLDDLERHHLGTPGTAGLVIGYGAVAGPGELRTACSLVRELVAAAPAA
ncbi:PLP-dependent aminotransferase family protein [Actinomadura viridis]|uniref:GntR family transcriptional regulator/MocR family aminotransferase n=1 Tax=Actinomadura viridis TaxID=58110 RepID=A0A931DG28_9ACTN|nr:PLP-dependent aminotransferase family protein [Actinomadura viridis]MBG6086093.1 GntR family transcriptional regulator/MocR family aminotransferase [Actinomadura viridis]